MTDLITLDKQRLEIMVKELPIDKRAAFSKAVKAACQHLRDSKENYGKAYELASVMVENWWLMGVELQKIEFPSNQHAAPQGECLTLASLGVNFNQSARCQKLAEMSQAELTEWLQSKYDESSYYLPSLRPASEHVHVGENTGAVEWYTPSEIIEAARSVLGTIDLDPASSKTANTIVKSETYFDVNDNGLEQDWFGNVWMNPPYASGLIDKFIEKLSDEIDAKRVSRAITLTNNATDTKWFSIAAHQASAMCTIQGRIRYLDESLTAARSPLQGQVVMYFGKAISKFKKEFSGFGFVWVKE